MARLTPENCGETGEVRLTCMERTRFMLWLCAELIEARKRDDKKADALRTVLEHLHIVDDAEESHAFKQRNF